ncbi:uncharacterized protein LOC123686185 [Harmonia axyridis]|uniref:uncharacterized protein LOC123686185 n=1 Tax=Harmonia axyridis TaxID=115357 RepID=UPI001E276AD1|nr:uncharacterized protein LOC123686185 [Harmonia axyridis]
MMAEALSDSIWFRGLDLPPRNANTEMSIIELRKYRKYDRLVLIMHFPHYYEAAKKDIMLRTLVIREAHKYLERSVKTENMQLLCERLKDEFKQYEESLAVEEHIAKIRYFSYKIKFRKFFCSYGNFSSLSGRDMCTIASRNFFLRRIIVQNSHLRTLLLGALEQEIEDDSDDSPFLEYLVRCIRNNLWSN